jgi:hypothetical protein
VREKDDAAGRADDEISPDSPRPVKYRRATPDAVRRAARRAFAGRARPYSSQAELRRALLPILRRKDPLLVLGGRRMRRLLLEVPGVRLRVRYAERATRRPLTACPVCDAELRPIRNRTLCGDRIVLGYRCTRCAYWTHLRRRVPVRYAFAPVGEPESPDDA